MTFSINKVLIRSCIILIGLFNILSAQASEYDQFKLDMLLANRGDSGAQFYVAGAYEEGRGGVKKDLKKAFEWFRKAADNKHNGAQYKLGEFYRNGWGVSQDLDKANYWYKEAAKNGSRLAKNRISKLKSDKQAEITKLEKDNAIRLKNEQKKKKLAEEKVRKLKQRKLDVARAKRAKEERLKKQKIQKEKLLQLAKVQKAGNTPKKVKLADKQPQVSKKTVRKISVAEMIDSIMLGKWRDKSGAASILPSSVNNCLKASDKEIICFSSEQQRVVANSELIFTTKSTLTNFKNNGQFQINYYYNVAEITPAAGKGVPFEPSGLRIEKGWQEPQQVMNCAYLSKTQLKCVKGKYKFNFRI